MFHSNWRFRLVLFSLIVLVVLGYYSYVEMVYLFQSRSARATVTGSSVVTVHRRGSNSQHLQVDFTFAEPNGVRRRGSDSRPLGWKPDSDGAIPVQYTPGEYGRSRIAGNVNSTVLILFGCSLVVLIGFGVFLWLGARAATREPERNRRREE